MWNLIRRQIIVWRALLTISLFWPAAPVDALVVGSSAVPPAATNVNPASYPGWASGDPGWNNVSVGGHQGVYLGDGWVMSARHVGLPLDTQTITFETPTGPASYQSVPGQNFIVHNPPPALAGGLNLISLENGETDLRLYRIAGAPNISAPAIASRSQFLPEGAQVVTISRGSLVRQSTETTWYVNTTGGASNWTWSESPGGHQKVFKGFKTDGTNTERRWGTNSLVSPSTSAISSIFESTLSGTTGVVRLLTPDGMTRYVIAMATLFDHTSTGGGTWETQSMSGDSGAAAFYNYGTPAAPQWKLAGITNFVANYNNQPGSTAIYGEVNGSVSPNTGNATFQSDLSYYNQAYSQSICDIMRSCGNYSVMGDVNLDGIVAGTGTGPVPSDDISAFVAGWRYDNGASHGDYVSWTKGDLNLDGKTDAADFFKLRQAFIATGSWTPAASAFTTTLLGVAVPEPSAAALLLLAAGSFLATARRRRTQLTA